MFAAITCPYCKKVKGAAYGIKHTKCSWCGKKFEVFDHLVVYKSDSESEIASAIARANAVALGGEGVLEELAMRDAMKGENTARPGKQALIEKLASTLGKSEFTEEDFAEALESNGLKPEWAAKYLKMLVEKNLIYEPRNGKYKAL